MANNKTLDPASVDYNMSVHSLPIVSQTKDRASSISRVSHCGASANIGEEFYEIPLGAITHVESAPIQTEKNWRGFETRKSTSAEPVIVLLCLSTPQVASCVENSDLSNEASATHDVSGQSEQYSFQRRSFNDKIGPGEEYESSNLSSAISSDPCRDLEGGPHMPPNPIELGPSKKVRINNLLQDPFSRQMLERYQSYRPTGSQHNSEAPLDFQHPYQAVPESENWTKRMRSWFVNPVDSATPVQIWPPPITIAVNNNKSSSSFLFRSPELPITMEENLEPTYTPQGIPLGVDKRVSSATGSHGITFCCWLA